MDINKNQFMQKATEKNPKNSNTSLLRIGVIFLAVVSFFTTANGMQEYIFIGEDMKMIAYAASAAIQSILLALSMNLPEYILNIWKREWSKLFRLILCGAAILLTIVAIFCSSWFSYVYIADVIHKDSWGTDSELLVQQTYRTELYDARDYAHTYRVYLEESIGEKILLLENQAGELSNSAEDYGVDWSIESENYGRNSGTAAASYMTAALDAMERALSPNASQEDRDFAAVAVAEAKLNLADRLESIQQEIVRINGNIEIYNGQIESLTRRINNATEDTNIEALSNSLNRYIGLIDNETQQQLELQTENMQLQNALFRLPIYESYLGLNNSTSSTSIRSALIRMQSEFFQQEPDIDELLEIATDIFENLRNASHGYSEEGEAAEDSLTYTNLLVQMNQLIRNLRDYSEIKNIENELEEMTVSLRSVEDAIEIGESEETEKDSDWKRDWRLRLNELKAKISAMPVYSEDGEINSESEILSETQVNILNNYDRDESGKRLDDMIRRYIAGHNAIYDGIIYLQSPYRFLAIFALILAFSFDITGFVFGVIMQGNTQCTDENATTDKKDTQIDKADNIQPEWSIFATLNQYIVLTGDYERKDDIYYYKVFKNGILEQWAVKDEKPYIRGIYIQDKGCPDKGKIVGKEIQKILFSGQSNKPKDGIYVNCQLVFDEGGLFLIENEQRLFIAGVNEYVPVHSYNSERGENRTMPVRELALKGIDVQIVVVALNAKGTQVVAVYIMEQ